MLQILLSLMVVSNASLPAQAGEVESKGVLDVAIGEGIPNPFKRDLKKVDPSTGQKVDAILYGPVYKARGGSEFDYYRYVTFYNIQTRKERAHDLPIHREECDDKSDSFANWSVSYTFTTTVHAGVTIEGLGVSSDFSGSHTSSFTKFLHSSGAVSDRIPYYLKQDWEGLTYLETVNTKTGAEKIVLRQNGSSPYWLQILFPWIAPRKYPMEFQVNDAEWTFEVERKVIAPCPGSGAPRESVYSQSINHVVY